MKKMIVMVAILTLVAFAGAAMAQQKPAPAPAKPASTPAPAPAAPAATPAAEKPAKLEKYSGAVEKVDEMAKSFVVKSKKDNKTFVIDDKTKITKGKNAMPFGELKAGMGVSVQYKKEGDKMIAASVKVSAPKAK